MSTDLIKLKWVRPKTTEHPKVWRTFKARDLDSDELVEYRIQDLPESKFEDAINLMIESYLPDEPITQSLNGSKDKDHIADYSFAWRSILPQKSVLACFREGSDELVGVNMNYVHTKADNFIQDVYDTHKSPITKELYDMLFVIYEGFDTFEKYGVSEYLAAFGLTVDKRFRGRNIGARLLEARKDFCREFGLKITHSIFTSDFSIRNAASVGFKLDKAIAYVDLYKSHPEFHIQNIKAKQITLKTLVV